MSNFQTYGNISKELNVANTSDWLEVQGIDPDNESYEDNPVIDIVGKLIALDVAIFIQRRTAYICGSNIDYLGDIHREYQKKYFELSGEPWDLKDFNKDIDW